MGYFERFDLAGFWKDSDYSRKEYVLPPPTDISIAAIEKCLGYKLPKSYVELMRRQNGGLPSKTAFPSTEPTSWAKDHVAIEGILGIGDSKNYSLCGSLGSQFKIDEWGYPEIGVYFGTCPSAGHDMICLDYRKCGRKGEPQVVHVDQDLDYKITFLAENFEDFIKGLVDEDQIADSEDEGSVAFIWRTEAITASIRRDDEFLRIGQYLYLEQDPSPDETGWLSMKINIPEHWQVQSVLVGDGLVRLETESSGSFCLTRENVGKLSYEILDGGDDKSDDDLQSIWMRHAAIGE